MVELPESPMKTPRQIKKLKKTKPKGEAVQSPSKKAKKSKAFENGIAAMIFPEGTPEKGQSPSKNGKAKKEKSKKLKNGKDKDMDEPAKKMKKVSDIASVAVAEDAIDTPPMSDEDERSPAEIAGDFKKFRIADNTIQLLKDKKITYLFPVQIKTFDHVFDGYDVVAQARTGTGKTLSFALPLVEKLQGQKARRGQGRPPKVLVMAPTRELALQVYKDFDAITEHLKCLCVYGGTPYFPQEKAMRNGLDIVVGTPGRILDHVNKGNLDLGCVDHVVLDEVDQMLDMGFAPSVEEILQYAYHEGREKQPQTLLFSATCPPWVKQTARKYMRPDETHHVDLIGKDTMKTATTVQHLAIRCHYSQRAQCIGDVVQVYSGRHGRAIIFTETKREANELGLNDSVKVETQVLHGDIEQRQREITLKAFREGSVKCLVATNVAARGLDIPEVDLVIQINPPKDIESYIHRSGRTGRAGRLGTCVCFYKPNEESLLQRVERTARIKFKRVGPPQPKDIIQSSYDDSLRSLDAVPENVCSQFLNQAEKVADKYTGGALEALAAALAYMSGATKLSARSLLNSQEGFTTWLMVSTFEVRFVGFFFNVIERSLGMDIRGTVKGIRMAKDKKGAVFDMPTDLTAKIRERWEDSDRLTLTEADHIPELLESENRFSDRGSGGGRGRGRGRGFGGGNGRFGGRPQGRGGRGGRGGFSGRGSSGRGGYKRKWND